MIFIISTLIPYLVIFICYIQIVRTFKFSKRKLFQVPNSTFKILSYNSLAQGGTSGRTSCHEEEPSQFVSVSISVLTLSFAHAAWHTGLPWLWAWQSNSTTSRSSRTWRGRIWGWGVLNFWSCLPEFKSSASKVSFFLRLYAKSTSVSDICGLKAGINRAASSCCLPFLTGHCYTGASFDHHVTFMIMMGRRRWWWW